MIHLGDITKIDWSTVEPVDCVTGGSPCQDLSIAGARKGLAGERSGLFMEQIRCVKELRAADVHRGRTGIAIRPRYMVWENVPGAFSSTNRKDFGAVLEEIVRIVEPEAPAVPMPEKGWPKAGCLYDELGRWSVAWRVHDAKFWGVPQRRKRISVVADFGGLSAPEVLFERKGLSGDFEPGETPEKETAGETGGGVGTAISFQERGGKPGGGKGILIQEDRTGALSTLNNQYVLSAGFKHKAGSGAGGIGYEPETTPTLSAEQQSAVYTTLCLNDQGGSIMDVTEDKTCTLRAQSHGHEPIVYDARGNGNGKTVPTITGDHESRVTDYTAICIGNGQLNQITMAETANTLNTMHDQQAVMVAHSLRAQSSDPHREDAATYPITNGYARRLTPLECERLQGYPDRWTDIGDWVDSKGKRHKSADGPRYKAEGNSIALPFWFWLLRRISAQYERVAYLGSLFDGIGGFPLCWERCNGKGTARWASEIEEFPMAVTKYHFGED